MCPVAADGLAAPAPATTFGAVVKPDGANRAIAAGYSLPALTCFDPDTLPCIHIDDRQRPETHPILQLIGNESDEFAPPSLCVNLVV